MANGCASSRRWILIGGPPIAFNGAVLRASFVTSTSEYSFRKYALASDGDVWWWRGNGGNSGPPGAEGAPSALP